MFLKAISPVSVPYSVHGSDTSFPLSNLPNSAAFPPQSVTGFVKRGNGVSISRASGESAGLTLSGVLFLPFEEVQKDELVVPDILGVSLARQRYSENSEAAINEQINVEYSVSYAYHSLYAYFDRDNVALKGFANFFKESSKEEREHAEKLMEYQNKRGGRVKLYSITLPPSEFDDPEKGEALYAMELALSMEKLVNEKLLKLHAIASDNNDPQLTEFIESEFLGEQVESIKKISEFVSQLRRIGKGHGVWHFDKMLLDEHVHA